jgi:hypothetical protein
LKEKNKKEGGGNFYFGGINTLSLKGLSFYFFLK